TLRVCRMLASLTGLVILLAACNGASGPPATTGSSGTNAQGSSPGSSSGSSFDSAAPTEKPVAAESNPPGDIPDNTQFVPYASKKGRFLVKVPEGWSRRTRGTDVSFTDKLNTVEVTWSSSSSAPTVSSVKTSQVSALRSSLRAFT